MAMSLFRKEGWTGRITMITADTNLPYDRPKLSKNLGVKHEAIMLRKPAWYEKVGELMQTFREYSNTNYFQAKIEVRKGVRVTGIEAEERRVRLEDGAAVEYSKLLVCTGGVPRQLGVRGEDLAGVSYLRTIADANLVHREAARKHVVVIGTSFIGMEVAAALIDHAASVTVIGRDKVPFQVRGETF